MFQLRFLLATPRKAAPHIFCHRDYRGQRTQQDDFHPAWNTYVCQPKGEKTSHDVMLDLMLHSAANQAASHLFPIIEVWNPATNDRLKLAGDEIILRPSDLAAAQEAFNKKPFDDPTYTEPAPVNDVNPVNEVPTEPPSLPVPNEIVPAPPSLTVLDRVRTEIQTHGKATATQLANTLGISAAAIKDAVNIDYSGLQNKGGWISLT
jgi:hypothetical protein